jgi:hypothetical protein
MECFGGTTKGLFAKSFDLNRVERRRRLKKNRRFFFFQLMGTFTMGRTTTVEKNWRVVVLSTLDSLREEEGRCRGNSSSFVSNTRKG